MSSKQIADITGKRHNNVIRDCKALNETYEKLGQLKIEQSTYINDQNKEQPMLILDKMQVMALMTGYNAELRIKVIQRWQELELGLGGTPIPELIHQYANTLTLQAMTAKALKEAKATIEENEPKVLFANSVAGCVNLLLTRQVAKDMSDDKFTIGEKRLFRWFRQHKYLNPDNEPYQPYVDQGLFKVITRTVGAADSTIQKKTTKITGKGLVYFTKKVKDSYPEGWK